MMRSPHRSPDDREHEQRCTVYYRFLEQHGLDESHVHRLVVAARLIALSDKQRLTSEQKEQLNSIGKLVKDHDLSGDEIDYILDCTTEFGRESRHQGRRERLMGVRNNPNQELSDDELQARQDINLALGEEIFKVMPQSPSLSDNRRSNPALITPGGKAKDAFRIRKVLDHVFKTNAKEFARKEYKYSNTTPVCIWGTHGLGKTEMIKAYADEHGWEFAYCAPGQFEEMGELHGFPKTDEATGTMVYSPPRWVPKHDGPGILLLDDFNRAGDRILRGLMQLLQDGGLASWQLPKGWNIVLTANPGGADYSISELDPAMLDRAVHISMTFDAKAWAKWATASGVDTRGISFVLTYPEMVSGGATTPRSLVRFFRLIEDISDLKGSLDMVTDLAESALEPAAVLTFVAFVNDALTTLIDPEEILGAEDFDAISKRLDKLVAGSKGTKRVDRIATVCTRLYIALTAQGYKPGKRDKENVVMFMLHPSLPNDLRLGLHSDLQESQIASVLEIIRDKRLGELMLKGM